jgi:hypothetical protein
MNIKRAKGWKGTTAIDKHLVVCGLSARSCLAALRRALAAEGREVGAAWYGRKKRRALGEELCRVDLFVHWKPVVTEGREYGI